MPGNRVFQLQSQRQIEGSTDYVLGDEYQTTIIEGTAQRLTAILRALGPLTPSE